MLRVGEAADQWLSDEWRMLGGHGTGKRQVRLSFLKHTYYSVNAHFPAAVMTGNESASSRTREAFMQEEPNRRRHIQPLHVPITIGPTVCHTCVMW
jgi:hypothetical protein